MDERAAQRQFEDQFLGQIRARALALTRGKLKDADEVLFEATPEGVDALRDELSRLEVYDRSAIDKLPGTRSVQMRFQKRVLGGLLRRQIARLRVRVLTQVDDLLHEREPQPIGREQVLDALARYEILPRKQRPSGVILASPTGFTPEARRIAERSGQPSVILMGGREDGGWDVAMPEAVRSSHWVPLFDLESHDERLKRLLYHLEENADLVDSRGVSMRELSDKLGLSRIETERLVRQACRGDSRLMTVVDGDKTHVCRTPLAEEGDKMSIWSRVRRLLRLKPSTAERVRDLTAQRVRVEQQRFELDQRIDALEASERGALQNGAQAKSSAEKKQYAGKLIRVRRDLKRNRAQAQVYTNQIDVIGTQIHHLTLAEQGRRVSLPSAEDLTKQAAEAEQVMTELSANAELANSIEVTGETPMMAEEEEAIFAEFDQIASADTAATDAAVSNESASVHDAEPAAPERSGAASRKAATSPPPADKSKDEKARPEIG